MGQAFDEEGMALGPELLGETFKEVFDKVQDQHKDAAEIRLRKLHEAVDEVRNSLSDAMCREIVSRIDAKGGEGFAKKLAEMFDPNGTWPVDGS